MKSRLQLLATLLMLLASSVGYAQLDARMKFDSNGSALSVEGVTEKDYTLRDGKHHSECGFKWFRDSHGRTRQETCGDDAFPNLVSIVILDPVRGVEIFLFPKLKTAQVQKIKIVLAPAQPPQPGPTPIVNSTREDLGSKEIEGHFASGTRVSSEGRNGSHVREEWFSSELKMTLLFTSTYPWSKTTSHVVDIHLGEPDPSLFEVPEGYTVKNIDTSL
jgi:hypothetical protein